jgi:hypothetical protein
MSGALFQHKVKGLAGARCIMLDQLIMTGTCFYGDGRHCGGIPLQDVIIVLGVVITGCVGLLVAYKKFLARDERKLTNVN